MALRDPEQAKLLAKATRRRSKYNASSVVLDGITFDSRAEAARYIVLKRDEAAHEIRNLRVHPKYAFKCGASYKPDFEYLQSHRVACGRSFTVRVVEDVKSAPTRTRIYLRNKAMMKDEHGINVSEVEVSPATASALVAAYRGARA